MDKFIRRKMMFNKIVIKLNKQMLQIKIFKQKSLISKFRQMNNKKK